MSSYNNRYQFCSQRYILITYDIFILTYHGHFPGSFSQSLLNDFLRFCTAAYGSSNISKWVVDNGAKISVGWTTEVYAPDHGNWLYRFNYYLSQGYSVNAACNYADSFTYSSNSGVQNNVKYGLFTNELLIPNKAASNISKNSIPKVNESSLLGSLAASLSVSSRNLLPIRISSGSTPKTFAICGINCSDGFDSPLNTLYAYDFEISLNSSASSSLNNRGYATKYVLYRPVEH